MESWVESAINQWRLEEVKLNSPASISYIEQAESILNFRFPEDFKQLYLAVNGFADFEVRGFFLSLWSLESIVDDYNKANKLIIFGDFSLSVCQYGFDRNRDGIFRAYTHHQQEPVEFVANTFQEIVGLINRDSELLF